MSFCTQVPALVVRVAEPGFPGILDSVEALRVGGNLTGCQNFEGLTWFGVAQRGVGRAVSLWLSPCISFACES